MTTNPETETVARILARGYNRHIADCGPDSSAAGEAIEMADGHGLLVVRDGAEYAIRVTRAQAMTAPGPLTPGQCWAALRAEIAQERAAQDEIAADQAELGHDWSSERAYGRVEALDQMMAWMDREDGTS